MAPAGFWLVRHGPPPPAGVAIGSRDPPLSAEGTAQAEALGQKLARRPIAAVYASDSVRAVETASAIASHHRLPGVQVDIRLRELDFGRWEDRALAELWSEEPEAAVDWEKDLRSTPSSFGESVSQLEERVAA